MAGDRTRTLHRPSLRYHSWAHRLRPGNTLFNLLTPIPAGIATMMCLSCSCPTCLCELLEMGLCDASTLWTIASATFSEAQAVGAHVAERSPQLQASRRQHACTARTAPAPAPWLRKRRRQQSLMRHAAVCVGTLTDEQICAGTSESAQGLEQAPFRLVPVEL